ncbi:FtsK/SpoIIIE family DNA translocase [Thermovenabulum gondwanense]|uniref:DNA translocase SpoIIIE n=1 Tax=Thermovenabulum gondwanense TaxID=520767 RepID=A0A162MFS6_9FIRM|nr:DNA translocase FtsK [Thermovenabulum gondwanense]KYO65753.1 DNA translocase SpoIIIE [Thermovenabulum gondwanense]
MKTVINKKRGLFQEIKGIVFVFLGMYFIISLYFKNTGAVGNFIKNILYLIAGEGAVVFSVIFLFIGLSLSLKINNNELNLRTMGAIIIFIVVSSILHFKIKNNIISVNLTELIKESILYAKQGKGGGILGAINYYFFFKLFGLWGFYIFITALSSISITLITGSSPIDIMLKTFKRLCKRKIKIKSPIKEELDKIEAKNDLQSPAANKSLEINELPIKINNLSNNNKFSNDKDEDNFKTDVVKKNSVCENYIDYKLPPISLLKKSPDKGQNLSEKEILNTAQVLENTLLSFGIQAKVIEVGCGPTVTRFELQPSPGVKVSKIVSLADDIALSLAVPDVRIEAPIPGKSAVGIEIPNKEVSRVFLRDIIESPPFKNSDSPLTAALGKDIAGKPIVADLQEMPHLLIAGATGSGKSICINCIILSILFKTTPMNVRLLLIDPKRVELSCYNGIPHLLTPVINDPKKASAALNWMVSEMERRYQLFAQKGVKDINRYNEIIGQEKLPKILIIIDELADLMMVSPKEVEDSICRLAQMARAAGMHLIVATQRPSVDVITGLIKANIPSRISFAVSSQVDSRTILDMAGAEKLLGKGDMLFLPIGASKPVRVQGAYISEKEIDNVLNFIKNQMKPTYEKNLEEIDGEIEQKNYEELDELFREALKIVFENGQASVSLLQRKLRVGYARAARLIDQLEAQGIISGYDGAKPRQVLINKEQYDKLMNK